MPVDPGTVLMLLAGVLTALEGGSHKHSCQRCPLIGFTGDRLPMFASLGRAANVSSGPVNPMALSGCSSPSFFEVSWVPVKGQEGADHEICVHARDRVTGSTLAVDRCVTVKVSRRVTANLRLVN